MTILSTIFNIHKEAAAQQDVLAFLTLLEEMESMARQMRSTAKEFPDRPRLEVVTLYAAKAKLHQAGAGLNLLKVVRVSKAQTKQWACRESEGTLSESPQHQEKCVISHVFLTLP